MRTKGSGWLLPDMPGTRTSYFKKVRTEAHVTAQVAATICGISPGHLSSLESGRKLVTEETAVKLKKLLVVLGLKDEEIAKVLL